MMNNIVENRFIQTLTELFTRSSQQLNRCQESDAEIVRLPMMSDRDLAITTDSVVEEIAAGLYTDPYLIGWMTVMTNMSDLAAVGAQPIGIVVSEVLPSDLSNEFITSLQRGIEDASSACGTFVLGGDTNRGEQLLLTGCAIGTVANDRRLTRKGYGVNDILFATNFLGGGNAFALQQLWNRQPKEIAYLPQARLREGAALHSFATACMDTSDGVIATLDQMMRLNNLGFELEENWIASVHPSARHIVDAVGIPSWLMLAGQHGEFELLFTVPSEMERKFMLKTQAIGWNPLRIGRVIAQTEIRIPLYNKVIALDTARIRNLFQETHQDINGYLSGLMHYDFELQEGVYEHDNA